MHVFVAGATGAIGRERLPAYAPDLNPVEGLWFNLKGKGGELANLTYLTLDGVIEQARRARCLRDRPSPWGPQLDCHS